MRISETRYATSEDGISIAFRTVGEGPRRLVFNLAIWGLGV